MLHRVLPLPLLAALALLASAAEPEAQAPPAVEAPPAAQPPAAAPAPAVAEAPPPATPVSPPAAAPPPRVSLFHRRPHGALRWKELFQPAIRAASLGFKVPARLALFLGEGSPFPPTNEVRTLFSRPDGETIQEGDLFRNPEYAHTLERIALDGPRALYEGAVANEIVATTHQAPFPGTMTLKDLTSYRAIWPPPLCRPYRGYT